jgi:hypothetical protein
MRQNVGVNLGIYWIDVTFYLDGYHLLDVCHEIKWQVFSKDVSENLLLRAVCKY